MGFYEKPSEWTPIRVDARRGRSCPRPERVELEALRTESATFKAARRVTRAAGSEAWFHEPVGTHRRLQRAAAGEGEAEMKMEGEIPRDPEFDRSARNARSGSKRSMR